MNKNIIYLLVILLTTVCYLGTSQTTADNNDILNMYILREEHSYPIERIEKELLKLQNVTPTDSDIPRVITKILLLFRRATFLDSEEKTRAAYKFIEEAYDSHDEFQIPVMLTYKGVSRSMIAGSLTSFNPFPKLTLLGEGKEMIDAAIQKVENSHNKNTLILGYLYFLRGRTYTSVPTFLKLSKEAPKNLKKALSLFRKTKNIHPTIIANVFYAYGIYYHNKGNIKVAIKNMNIAKKYAKTNPWFYQEVDNKLKEIQGK